MRAITLDLRCKSTIKRSLLLYYQIKFARCQYDTVHVQYSNVSNVFDNANLLYTLPYVGYIMRFVKKIGNISPQNSKYFEYFMHFFFFFI